LSALSLNYNLFYLGCFFPINRNRFPLFQRSSTTSMSTSRTSNRLKTALMHYMNMIACSTLHSPSIIPWIDILFTLPMGAQNPSIKALQFSSDIEKFSFFLLCARPVHMGKFMSWPPTDYSMPWGFDSSNTGGV
jgi:hypothetical protein